VTPKAIRVGIVGANAKAGWARVSHVPAINGLPTAEAFGADRWFSDPLAMIRDDLVDLVTIAVNVPAHRVRRAADRGERQRVTLLRYS
jgi:predicted dehydrogenase